MKLTAIDLFSGCGGLSLGLHFAGFRVLAAIEQDRLSALSYKANHRHTRLLVSDIRRIDAGKVRYELGLAVGELDLLAGCPPCQGFSTLRTLNGSRLCHDEQNDLIFEFLRFAAEMRPKALMLENVPGLIEDHRLTKFVNSIRRRGYSVQVSIFDAADFGVPQRRRRLILIASRIGAVDFASALGHKETVFSTIGHLAPPGAGSDPLHDYHESRLLRVRKIIERIPQDGGSRRDLPDRFQLSCHKRSDGFADVYGRMAWDEVAPTITTGCINPSKGRFLHPTQNRAITLREAALLQGFPSKYSISMAEGRYRAAELIGNAFPPPFAKAHALRLYKECVAVLNSRVQKRVRRF
jgi:DNA (cytosine-5)-methyltransferase 1